VILDKILSYKVSGTLNSSEFNENNHVDRGVQLLQSEQFLH